MALAKNAQKRQAVLPLEVPVEAPEPLPPQEKRSRKRRLPFDAVEALPVTEWVAATDPSFHIGVDQYTGRIMGYGTYHELKAIYEDQTVYEELCMTCGRPSEPDIYLRFNEPVLRLFATKLGIPNVEERDRLELAHACYLDITQNGWVPALDADLALNFEEIRLRVIESSARLSTLATKGLESPTKNNQGVTNMALAKAKPAADKPVKPAAAPKAGAKSAAKPAPAAKPAAASKPAAAKPAAKPAPAPKPAAAKPASPKPASAANTKPAQTKPASAPREKVIAEEQNGIKKPIKMDGKCGQVWVECDKLLKANKGKPNFSTADVIAARPDLSEGNVRVEAARWAKFYGHVLLRAPRAGAAE